MKKSYLKILLIEVVLLIALLLNSFVFKIANNYVISAIVLVGLVVSFFIIGYEKDNYRYKRDVFLNILIILLMYFFITYFLGFFTGFIRSAYSLRIVNVIKNITPVILLIVLSEFLRYLIFCKSKGSRLCIVLGTILFILIDVNTMVSTYNVFDNLGLTKMICLVCFPSLTKNIFLEYLTIKVGYKNCIFYRLIMELSVFLLPISPDFGEYINVVLQTVLPIGIMVKLNNMFNLSEERKIKSSRYNKRKLGLYTVITAMLFIIVVLTSGYFTYYAVTIGSGSMTPTISKGDVVIVKKMSASKVKEGQILVYNHDKKIIVHRVAEIVTLDDEVGFITKGDNNPTKDGYIVAKEDVIGISLFRIRYIGMPTVALNELLSR